MEEKVRRYNSKLPEFFNGLVQPTGDEQVVNGYRVKGNRTIDAENQIYIAPAAFQKNGCFVLVDDQQVDDLNEGITGKENSKVHQYIHRLGFSISLDEFPTNIRIY